MKKIYIVIAAAALVFGCKKPTPDVPVPPEVEKLPISITKTSDDTYVFDNGDKVGLYVVNYEDFAPSTLVSEGNYVDNMCFTYNGVWSPEEPIYWMDDETMADFYCYYPYSAEVSDVDAHEFSVAKDQSSIEEYRNSDFMWGKMPGMSPTAEPVAITLDHKMSRLVISLVPGKGYSETDMQAASVTIGEVKTDAKINLATGIAVADGEATEVVPYYENGQFCANIVPQTVTDVELVKIVLGDRNYVLSQSLTFEAGKQHKCTITVSKTDQGINIGVSDWIIDTEDYGGTVE